MKSDRCITSLHERATILANHIMRARPSSALSETRPHSGAASPSRSWVRRQQWRPSRSVARCRYLCNDATRAKQHGATDRVRRRLCGKGDQEITARRRRPFQIVLDRPSRHAQTPGGCSPHRGEVAISVAIVACSVPALPASPSPRRSSTSRTAAVPDSRGANAQATPISPIALEAVKRIDALFDVEREINGLSAAGRLAPRRSAPLVAAFESWMRVERAKLSRHAAVAKAIDYMLTRWEAFTRFLDDGRVCLSNNAAERALRGFATRLPLCTSFSSVWKHWNLEGYVRSPVRGLGVTNGDLT